MIKQCNQTILSWVAVGMWMGIIFFLSHQVGSESSDLSNGITTTIIHAIQRLFPFIPIEEAFFHHLIRKSAHFMAYFVLGMLVMHALGVFKRVKIMLGFMICVIYATTDEVHQLFIPGRSGEVRDVIIDSFGAAAGIGVYILGMFVFRRVMERKRRKA